MKTLVVFFSRAGQNYFGGRIKNVEVGNTAVAAKLIQNFLDADELDLKMETPYSQDYRECVEQAKADMAENAFPELTNLPENIDAYDRIILGYPNYCGTIPRPVATFLSKYSFAGKKILPFCTNEGSGLGRSESDIKELCPDAEVTAGMPVNGSHAAESENDLREWIERVG